MTVTESISVCLHGYYLVDRTIIEFSVGGEFFHCVGQRVTVKGFTSMMPWLAVTEKNLAQFAEGEKIDLLKVELYEIENMDALFEAQFSPLSDTGRSLSRYGKCLRYMKYISMLPSRLYCNIHLYKELTCPLDNFELLLFSMAGPDGKSFPLCPYCYNNPPFEGIDTLFGAPKSGRSVKVGKGVGMPCFLCPHPTCRHSLISQGVCACPECDGTLVLDPVSAPKWRLYCNICNCLVLLPEGAHRISTTKEICTECESTIIEVDFNKKTTPLKDGATLHVGCILCDELLHSLVEMKHGKSFFRRGGGRGRGRGEVVEVEGGGGDEVVGKKTPK